MANETPSPDKEERHYELRIEEEILTDEAVSQLLNCHLKSLQKEMREGRLRAAKRMGKWYILKSDLIDYIRRGNMVENAPEDELNV